MVVLIAGPSHTGKTCLAQKLLETYRYPYFSIDWLKMGLIRSGYTRLTPEDDRELEASLWPVVREIVKTAIENKQNLIFEGCYIPFDWKKDFEPSYLKEIRFCCLVMTEKYIRTHFEDILRYADLAEDRHGEFGYTMEGLIEEHAHALEQCKRFDCPYLLIDDVYQVDFTLE